jgi:hypothetical protein
MVKKYGLNLLMSCDDNVQAYIKLILAQVESMYMIPSYNYIPLPSFSSPLPDIIRIVYSHRMAPCPLHHKSRSRHQQQRFRRSPGTLAVQCRTRRRSSERKHHFTYHCPISIQQQIRRQNRKGNPC